MAESSESGSSTNNLINAGLAILTLVGGFYYIKGRSLTSDRPVAQPVEEKAFGEQTVAARLWEDPFKETKADKQPARSDVNVIIGSTGTNVILGYLDTNKPPQGNPELDGLLRSIKVMSGGNSMVVLLPVMLEDGRYSEDRESRIRSRIAVVAGLGVRGYVPDDAEHVGRVLIPWPKSAELDKAKASFPEILKTNANAGFLAQLPTNSESQLDLRYEWFIPRQFYPNSANEAKATNVLVLWLKEGWFDDDPLIRLPLLLDRLGQTNQKSEGNKLPVKLIGPRGSLTLSSMLPGQFPATNGYSGPDEVHSLAVKNALTNLLGHIDMFLACPSAMDEVLVSNVTRIPRRTIGEALTNAGFRSFHNFSVTDAQLAQEAYDEFQLRQVSLTNTQNHFVLIAEWDTFYSRMISLTFQAQLQVLLDTNKPPLTLQDYITLYRTNPDTNVPPNFHRFYYLQGLDGEMALSETGASGKAGSSEGNKSSPDSSEAFRQWQPDANKAEGPSQLDYVARLGDRLQAMNESLRRTNAGQIKVIGVVGSDVYDTLIILQALRSKFPEALFFTTDLDARFWHPKELKWSRNLLVFSGYGLALAPDLQRGVSPLRDNEQTAQYAATLAALGDTNLVNLKSISARRFEIGRHGAVDLSVLGSFTRSDSRLHPATLSESWGDYSAQSQLRQYLSKRERWTVAVFLTGAVLLCLFWRAAKRPVWRWSKFLCKALKYEEEDFGGPDGAVALWEKLEEKKQDPLCEWILKKLEAEFERMEKKDFLVRLKTKRKKLSLLEAEIKKLRNAAEQNTGLNPGLEKELKRKEACKREQELEIDGMDEALVNAVVAVFNRILKHKGQEKLQVAGFDGADAVTGLTAKEMADLASGLEEKPWTLCGRLLRYRTRLRIYKPTRKSIDKFLEKLSPLRNTKVLAYQAEDFGGPNGAVALREKLEKEHSPFCKWIFDELDAELIRLKEEELKQKEPRKRKLEMDAVVVVFNRIIKHDGERNLEVPESNELDEATGLTGREMKFLGQQRPKTPFEKLKRRLNRREINESSRKLLDRFLRKRLPQPTSPKAEDDTKALKKLREEALNSATAARLAAVRTVEFHQTRRRRVFLVLLFAVLSGALLAWSMWWDTLRNPEGQPLSFGNGASAWPAQICRLVALVAALYFCIAIYFRRRIAFADITRKFRLGQICPAEVPSGRVCAVKSWLNYTEPRDWKGYVKDIGVPLILYFVFCIFIFGFSGADMPFNPVRGQLVTAWNFKLLLASVICFFVLTFLTIDGARRCRKFILRLAAAPTEYPHVVRRHFARLNGNLEESYLDEWIDVQLIAELTEKMGGIVYYPSLVFALLMIARNETWAQWSWPPWLLTIFALNLLVAVASVLILQLAAGKAKRLAVANLKAKVKRLQNLAAPSKAESNASQAEKLLDEINSIRRGAFARAWESPLFGAMLLPSGGLTLVQALIWALGH